jgi:hypothetical protein
MGRMSAPFRAALLVLLVLSSLVAVAPAQGAKPGFPDAHRAAQAELFTGMLKLATWSENKELFLERDRLFKAILAMDPDNADARKGLRYSRKSDGSWVEPAPREAKNRNPKALEELSAKRAAVAAPYRARMLALLDEHAADAATRRAVYREVLHADPDDAFVHAELGEARAGDAWVLQETVTAKERRAQIKALVETALAGVGDLHAAPLSEMEKGLGLKFTQALSTRNVRVLGTGLAPEVEATARNCEAVGVFLRGVLGIETQHQPDFTVYLIANPKDGPVFVANLPGLAPEFRAFLKTCVGALIPGQPIVAYWDKDLAHRVDGASRQTIGDFLGRAYGLTLHEGWAWEGLGLYLNRELTGTRLTWFVEMATATAAKKQLHKKLENPQTNWMNEALLLLEQPDRPKLEATLAKDVNAMGLEDMLYAYALSAYLLEGRPKDLPVILTRIAGAKASTAVALAEVLQLDVPGVEERLRRWLSERR